MKNQFNTHAEKWNDKPQQLMMKTSTTAANTSAKKPSVVRDYTQPAVNNTSQITNNSKKHSKLSSVGAGIIHGSQQFLGIYQ